MEQQKKAYIVKQVSIDSTKNICAFLDENLAKEYCKQLNKKSDEALKLYNKNTKLITEWEEWLYDEFDNANDMSDLDCCKAISEHFDLALSYVKSVWENDYLDWAGCTHHIQEVNLFE